MFSEITVKDMIGSTSQKVNYNEVIITRQDLINMPKLMTYLSDNKYHMEEEINYDFFPINIQNGVGLIFLEYYEFTITINDVQYLISHKLYDVLKQHEILIGYLDKVNKLYPTHIEDTLDISGFSETELNEILLAWFSTIYRNFKSIYKDIPESDTLMDINLNKGYFNKVNDLVQHIVTSFSTYLKTQKGAIPFSQNFGSTIKQSLQRKADYFTKNILLEEIGSFINEMNKVYDNAFEIVDISYDENIEISTSITVYVTLKVLDEEPITLQIQG